MASEAVKVTELIEENEFTYSFEVTPDLKENLANLDADPTFFSVTWHAKSHKCKDLEIAPLKLAEFLRSQQKQVVMHISCDMLTKIYLERVLAFLQEKGICNLLLILGENFETSLTEFKCVLDLIKYIREISGQYFCIGIAGFSECDDQKILQMKEKIDAGANFIITQAFFEPTIYKTFVTRSAKAGINVPILPGVFPFENYKQLINFTNMCKVKVSDDILDYVKNNEGNESEGAKITKNLVQTIRSEFPATHFHFFTLNKINNICRIINDIR